MMTALDSQPGTDNQGGNGVTRQSGPRARGGQPAPITDPTAIFVAVSRGQ